MPRITLTPPTLADAPAIAATLADPATTRWLPSIPHPYTPEDARAFVTQLAQPEDLAIRVDGDFAGMIRTGPTVGYWLAPDRRGRGIATQAGILALSRQFDGGAPGVTAKVALGNDASARVLARLGFRDGAPALLDRLGGPPVPGREFHLSRDRFAALHPPRVETARLTAAPPMPADLPALKAIATTPSVARMLLIFTAEMSDADFAATHPTRIDTRPFRLAIRTRQGRLVGSIGLGTGPRPPIFYFLDPEAAGQGYASEIVPAFCTAMTDRYGLAELTAGVFADNPASARVLEKAGFVRGGDITLTSCGRSDPAPGWAFSRPTS